VCACMCVRVCVCVCCVRVCSCVEKWRPERHDELMCVCVRVYVCAHACVRVSKKRDLRHATS